MAKFFRSSREIGINSKTRNNPVDTGRNTIITHQIRGWTRMDTEKHGKTRNIFYEKLNILVPAMPGYAYAGGKK